MRTRPPAATATRFARSVMYRIVTVTCCTFDARLPAWSTAPTVRTYVPGGRSLPSALPFHETLFLGLEERPRMTRCPSRKTTTCASSLSL